MEATLINLNDKDNDIPVIEESFPSEYPQLHSYWLPNDMLMNENSEEK